MSMNVPMTFQVKFQNNVEMVLQQQKSKLLDAVDVQDDAGAEKVKVKDLVGNTEPQEADTRHGDTKWNNRDYNGVWLVKSNELYDADLVDNADRLATMIDLGGTATTGAAGTINRARDRRILEGFYGSVISGKEGTTTTPFPNGQIIPVTTGGASGAQKMNVAKLRTAGAMLTKGYVDDDVQRFMVLTADDNDALLTEVPATSSDFKGAYGGEFRNGKIIRLLGWDFIHMELDNPLLTTIPDLATDGSGYRKNPFWAKAGIRANFWQRLRTRVGEIPEKLWSMGYLAGTTLSATRTQPEMSGIILNQKG